MDFTNKTVLVTGANRGIGLALVNALLTRGVKKVYATARDAMSLPDFGDERVQSVTLDITQAAQVNTVAEVANDIDVLINNAGIATFTSLLDGPLDLLRQDMDTNYYGTLSMIRRFVPILEGKPEATIVNLVTVGAFVNFPVLGGYCASKSALFSASQGIRIELKPKNIALHTVNPGPIDTDMAKDFDADKASPESTAENILKGLENNITDIFPDAGGQGMFEVFKDDYLALENMVSEMHHAA